MIGKFACKEIEVLIKSTPFEIGGKLAKIFVDNNTKQIVVTAEAMPGHTQAHNIKEFALGRGHSAIIESCDDLFWVNIIISNK